MRADSAALVMALREMPLYRDPGARSLCAPLRQGLLLSTFAATPHSLIVLAVTFERRCAGYSSFIRPVLAAPSPDPPSARARSLS